MGAPGKILSVLAIGLLAFTAAGCSGPTLDDSLNPELGKAGCKPSSPAAGPERNFEIIGTPIAKDASASGLFFQRASDDQISDGHKFVVRVTGTGELGTELTAPSGEPAELTWGPEPHTGSSFERPGDEWGMGLPFDAPGCWELKLSRDNEPTAAFWFEVQ